MEASKLIKEDETSKMLIAYVQFHLYSAPECDLDILQKFEQWLIVVLNEMMSDQKEEIKTQTTSNSALL